MPSSKTRVIGIGNPLMGDDGVGSAAIELLQQQQLTGTVELIDAGCGGLDLLPLLAECRHAIIIDAADFSAIPGSIKLLTGAELNRIPPQLARLSSHQPGLPEVLAISKKLKQLPSLSLVFVQVETCQQKYALSAPVRAALPSLLQTIYRLLSSAT